MRVLGVDPGLTRCGLAVVEASPGKKGSLVHLEVATSDSKSELSSRLLLISNRIEYVLDTFKPEAVSLERVFAQANLKTVMGVAQVSGIVLAESAKRKILISMYTPTQVKSSVTGNGRSDKKQIGLMVQRLLDLDAIPKPADASDAIALALCHAWRVRSASVAQSNGKPRKAPKVVRS